MRTRLAVSLLVVAALAGLTSCIPARSGAACHTSEWGDDGSYALRCVKGHWARAMTRQQAAALLIKLFAAAKRPAVGEVVRPASLGEPQLANTADPSVLVDGGVTYVYATTTWLHVPVVALTDLTATHTQNDMYSLVHEAMPQTPAWASTTEIWAPSVVKMSGRFVMFFAAHRSGAPDANSDQCVGRAFSAGPTGPFVPDASPLTCGNDGVHGALDPSAFVAADGSAHLLVAMGGSADNIWTYPIDGNGTITGASTLLLTRQQPWQDWFLENPSMFWDGSTYLLAYSAGHWDSGSYVTGIARCASPTGPCTDRADGPWLSAVGDRSGPGGLSFFVGADGQARVAFESYAAGDVGSVGKRSTTIRPLFTDPWPRLG